MENHYITFPNVIIVKFLWIFLIYFIHMYINFLLYFLQNVFFLYTFNCNLLFLLNSVSWQLSFPAHIVHIVIYFMYALCSYMWHICCMVYAYIYNDYIIISITFSYKYTSRLFPRFCYFEQCTQTHSCT